MIHLFECLSLSHRGSVYGFYYYVENGFITYNDDFWFKVYLIKTKSISKNMLKKEYIQSISISIQRLLIRPYIVLLCKTLLDNMTDNTLPDD